MNKAEQLRAEMAKTFDSEEFLDVVCKLIKSYGSATFICDYHVSTQLGARIPTIATKDRQAAIDCATKEGFRYSKEVNNYGVHGIKFYL